MPPKEYRGLPHSKLPSVSKKTIALKIPLVEAVYRRTSTRNFSDSPLDLHKLSKLLYLSNAVLKAEAYGKNKIFHRAVPSSGGLCSIEIYPIILNVKGLEHGVYHYDSLNHQLDYLKNGDFRHHIQNKLVYQQKFSGAAVIQVLSSWFSKLKFKYGERGYRYGFLDAGHVGENAYLAAASLDLACCGICGFIDDEVNSL